MLVSIDPGKSGAWALFSDCGTLDNTYKIKTPNKQRYLSVETLIDLNVELEHSSHEDQFLVIMEAMLDRKMDKQSSKAMNTTASNHGRLSAIAQVAGAEVVEIQASVWKRAMGLYGMDKQASVDLVLTLVDEGFLLKPRMRKPNVDIAEAVLIGIYYGRKELGWTI